MSNLVRVRKFYDFDGWEEQIPFLIEAAWNFTNFIDDTGGGFLGK